ncbi:glycosyl transferase [Alicyclobacillaceae bacterium I2511]|nr:glycosyl transferase [Alicyclobacillaceae bacterium I2511]
MKVMKGLFKGLLVTTVLAAIGWVSIWVYFTRVSPIASQVKAVVLQRVAKRHIHFLTYEQLPVGYRQAVVATEDRTFYSNIGVDFFSIVRAAWVDLQQGSFVQGGSTLTQQLVHNTLLNHQPKTVYWKIRETIDAIGLYDTMSKQETLALYANDIYFGHGAYGLYAATQQYFGKPLGALNPGELAMLAGIPNAPSVYDPLRNLHLARERQQIVVQSMVADGVISVTEAKGILQDPIELA